jgi:hypothetical protein
MQNEFQQSSLKQETKDTDIVLNNVSALLQQLGHKIDAHEKQVEQKAGVQYQRNEQLVNNNINNLYVSVVILIRETAKQLLFITLKQTSTLLFQHFRLAGNVSFLTHADEQEVKQNLVTAQVLGNTQRAWKAALDNTEPPETSVEALLMSQAQDKFKELDCHRRVLVVALQTYQTNQLQNEIAFIKRVYDVKGQTLKALWERVQLALALFKEQCAALVQTTGNVVRNIQQQRQTKAVEYEKSVHAFMERYKTLWSAYKANVQLADDTHTPSNDLRVAIDTLLTQPKYGVEDTIQAVDLLQKHWNTVARYIEDTPGMNTKGGGGATSKGGGATSLKALSNTSKALQANADKMLFCAKNRAKVLQNAKSYRSTSEWVAALKKWDAVMKGLEQEAHVLRRVTKGALAVQSQDFSRHGGNRRQPAEPEVVATHRQWKRLIYALKPMAEQLQRQQQEMEHKQSSVYAVLLNKVGYELKQATDRTLKQFLELEEQHLQYERALVEVEQENFRLLDAKYQSESEYMSAELQGYGSVSERCLDLITKLFKLKTWQEHATRLKQQLDVLQPLVVSVSTTVLASHTQ